MNTVGCVWDEVAEACMGRGRWKDCAAINKQEPPGSSRSMACGHTTGCVLTNGICQALPLDSDLDPQKMFECSSRFDFGAEIQPKQQCEWDTKCEYFEADSNILCLPTRTYYCSRVADDSMCMHHPGCEINKATKSCTAVIRARPKAMAMSAQRKTMPDRTRDDDVRFGSRQTTAWLVCSLLLFLFFVFICVYCTYFYGFVPHCPPPQQQQPAKQK
jgi:hypothetical protein